MINYMKKYGNGQEMLIPGEISEIDRFFESSRNSYKGKGLIENKEYNVIFFGCHGEGNQHHGKFIREYCNKENFEPDFFLLNGDNFYENGVESFHSPLFKKCFEDPYVKYFPRHTFFPILGNHDYAHSVKSRLMKIFHISKKADPYAQIGYSSINNSWYMPGRYYSLNHQFMEIQKQPLFEFFCIDSNTILLDNNQQEWLIHKVKSSKALWKILVSHHPILTKGHHAHEPDVTGFNQFIIENKLYKGLNLIISAHEHNNQILHCAGNLFQIIVGNCSSKNPHKIHDKSNLIYLNDQKGDSSFGVLKITKDNIICDIKGNYSNFNFDYKMQRHLNRNKTLTNFGVNPGNKKIIEFANEIKLNINPNIPPKKSVRTSNQLTGRENIALNRAHFLDPNFKLIPFVPVGSKLSQTPKNANTVSLLLDGTRRISEICLEINQLILNWNDKSKIKMKIRSDKIKKMDSKLNELQIFSNQIIKSDSIFVKNSILNHSEQKIILAEIYHYLSEIYFYSMQYTLDHKQKNKISERQPAIEQLMAEISNIYSLIYQGFISYYLKSSKLSNINAAPVKALEYLEFLELQNNKRRAEEGYKFITKLKFNFGHA
ncbi:metallophosphoesterase [Silvanigrella aquatica]|uniref:Calcineurin-like phosphoesterase domain-containing protein n=1 Tax=Silvanigrella aquatica TaxID=1915309 RepID=A0A1L4CZJ0_9BACT|nr:metallophosphoesterase [Silvanigrella aquatica]APJ03360.1 hypothetical protein AXG55_05345 [Silvanigrella aquatica]